VQLELGGKNPAVVLADADLDRAAQQIARGAFLSAGQKCTATSRVVVDASVADDLTERLAVHARSWVVGDALDPATQIGPLASGAQKESVDAFLQQAREAGGVLVAGGDADAPSGGFFVRPAVVTGLPRESRVITEEVFGPVAAVTAVNGLEEGIREANNTRFGLTATVFTRDLRSAMTFAREVRAGVVKVNQESAGLEFHVPFGGMKESSNGSREQGKVAREFFTQWKTIYLDS
jgi:alpha-ketoglutaric semialdehyde dehydrogenase